MKRPRNLLLLGAILAGSLSGLAASGLLSTTVTLNSTGSVKSINVEIFWDQGCTEEVSVVDWGAPSPGDAVDKIVYVYNSGTAPMNINLNSSDWAPSEASNHLSLSWDREGALVNTGEVLVATLTLQVSPEVSGITDFSFNIIIEGSG